MNRKSEPHYQSEVIAATLVENTDSPTGEGHRKDRVNVEFSLFERMLSPQSLQWMMISGGGLLVLGFAIWLWSSGVFENPLVLAGTIGTLNLSLLCLGVWCSKWTRFKLAGRGLTLLSSLVLPLNLWVYDSHGLISLQNGEPLWIPALVCCVIYGIVARLTRDTMFVYTLVGGVVLTGLLFLACATTSPLWALLPIATFLVATAILCIVADGLFIETQGAFSREQFGLAFFRAGHAVMAVGLFTLVTGQFAHLASSVLPADLSSAYVPLVLATTSGKTWLLGIVLGALFAYGYCQFGHRRHSMFSAIMGLMAAWICLIAADLLKIQITWDLAMLIFGSLIGVVNLARLAAQQFTPNETKESGLVTNATPYAALALMIVALTPYVTFFAYAATPLYFGPMKLSQLLLATFACWTVPGIWRSAAGIHAKTCIATGAISVTTALISGAIGWGASPLMCLCLGIVLAKALAMTLWFSSADPLHLLCSSVAATTTALWWIMVSAGLMTFATAPSVIVAVGLTLVALWVGYASGQRFAVLHGGFMLMTALIQLFVLFEITSAYSILPLLSSFGISLLLVRKVIQMWSLPLQSNDGTMKMLESGGLVTIIVGALGSTLFAISLIANGAAVPALLGLQIFQVVPLSIAMLLTTHPAWKRSLVAVTTVSVVAAMVVCSTLSELSLLRRAEIGSLFAGVAMVIYGYTGWTKENARSKDRVTFNLVMGSLLLLVPLALGIAHDRFMGIAIGNPWRLVHEIGGLSIGLMLLGSGILCRIRSTTLAGAVLLSTLVFSNLFLIGLPKHLLSTSFMLMIGGATFFSVAILLSIYRERLVKIPGKIREGEGVFSVLKWR